jgi:DNA-directed RNA polymerase specialized sigma subunit
MQGNKLTEYQKQLINNYYKKYGYRHIKYCIGETVKRRLDETTMNDYIGVAEEAICKAAKNYDRSKNTKFSTFAQRNISSAISTVIRDANTQKRKPIGGIDSLDRVVNEEDKTTFGEIVNYIENETVVSNINNIRDYVLKLSRMETVVLVLRLLGVRTSEIEENLEEPKRKIKPWIRGISSEDKEEIIKKIKRC